MSKAVSIGIPVAMVVAATLILAIGDGRASEGAAITLYGVAVLSVIGDVIFRAGIASNADRDREEAARRFYDEHGRWPRRDEL